MGKGRPETIISYERNGLSTGVYEQHRYIYISVGFSELNCWFLTLFLVQSTATRMDRRYVSIIYVDYADIRPAQKKKCRNLSETYIGLCFGISHQPMRRANRMKLIPVLLTVCVYALFIEIAISILVFIPNSVFCEIWFLKYSKWGIWFDFVRIENQFRIWSVHLLSMATDIHSWPGPFERDSACHCILHELLSAGLFLWYEKHSRASDPLSCLMLMCLSQNPGLQAHHTKYPCSHVACMWLNSLYPRTLILKIIHSKDINHNRRTPNAIIPLCFGLIGCPTFPKSSRSVSFIQNAPQLLQLCGVPTIFVCKVQSPLLPSIPPYLHSQPSSTGLCSYEWHTSSTIICHTKYVERMYFLWMENFSFSKILCANMKRLDGATTTTGMTQIEDFQRQQTFV